MASTVAPATATWRQVYKYLEYLNNALLVPMFTIIIVETGSQGWEEHRLLLEFANFGFCFTFLSEWVLGLVLADDRRGYLKAPDKFIDLISSVPFGHLFQALRFLRVLRALRFLRVVLRARRYQGFGGRAVKMGAVVGSVVVAGAVALRIAEPSVVPEFSDALWWSLVTLSTVGYGDLTPATPLGRGVAATLMIFGIGVFGYVAGFMGSVLDAPDEEDAVAANRRIEAKLDALCEHLGVEVAELREVDNKR